MPSSYLVTLGQSWKMCLYKQSHPVRPLELRSAVVTSTMAFFLSVNVLAGAFLMLPSRSNAAPLESTCAKNSTAPFDMPVTWTPAGFTTDVITIGTPPQNVTSFTDWTWVGQYVISPLCHGVPDPSKCLPRGQGTWNYSQSTTFVNETAKWGWSNGSTVRELLWNPNHFFVSPA